MSNQIEIKLCGDGTGTAGSQTLPGATAAAREQLGSSSGSSAALIFQLVTKIQVSPFGAVDLGRAYLTSGSSDHNCICPTARC